MKKIITTIILVVFLMFCGCRSSEETIENNMGETVAYEEKQEAEIVELIDTVPKEATTMSVPSKEYSGIKHYILPGISDGKLYQWIKDGEQESYSVLSFRGTSGYALEMNIGAELTAKCASMDGAVVLADSADTKRLYVIPLDVTTITTDGIKNSTKEDLTKGAKHSLVYQGGYYEKIETAGGWQITYEVENLGWHGYIVDSYNLDAQEAFEFIYIETEGTYESSHALKLVQGVRTVKTDVTQIAFDKTIELREFVNYGHLAENYFEGSTYGLSMLSLADIGKADVGNKTLSYSKAGTKYVINLELVDTLVPEVTFAENTEQTKYFVPNDVLGTEELAEMFFEAEDESGKVTVTLADGSNTVCFSKDKFGEEQPVELQLYVADNNGNCAEVSVSVAVLSEARVPKWYSLFFSDGERREAEDALMRLMSDKECSPEEYLTGLYEGGYSKQLISNEVAEMAVTGYERLLTNGIQTSFKSGVDLYNEACFYAGVANLPIELFQAYIPESGKTIELKLSHAAARNIDEAVATKEMKETVTLGMQRAEKLKIEVSTGDLEDIINVAKTYSLIGNCDENVLNFYDDHKFFIVRDSIDSTLKELINMFEENATAIEFYKDMKEKGVALECVWVSVEELVSMYNYMSELPEGILELSEEHQIRWVIASEDLINPIIVGDISYWELVEKGIENMKKAGINSFPNRMTTRIANTYCYMASVPEDILKLCAESGYDFGKIEGDRFDVWQENATTGYQLAKDKGVQIVAKSAISPNVAESFFAYLTQVPEEIWALYEDNSWELVLGNRIDTLISYKNRVKPTLYDKALSGYYRAIDIGLDIERTDSWTPIDFAVFYSALDDIPVEILEQYEEKSWEIVLEDERIIELLPYVEDMNQAVYDKALSGYCKAKDIGLELEVLDVWNPIEFAVLYAGIDTLPLHVLERYEDLGWKLVLSSDNLTSKYDFDIEVVGVASYNKKLIEMTENWLGGLDNTILHEMGHFVDWSYTDNSNICSYQSEMVKLYNKYKKKENGGNDDRGYSDEILRNLSIVCYREYAFTDYQEFFADSFDMYLTYPETFKQNYPDVYSYIEKCLNRYAN